jgi:transcriptional regulator with XRE-family HTH domain
MRSRRKITQEDLVGRLAVQEIFMTQAQIAKIESGTRPVKDFELIAIAKALRVSVQNIVDETLKAERRD